MQQHYQRLQYTSAPKTAHKKLPLPLHFLLYHLLSILLFIAYHPEKKELLQMLWTWAKSKTGIETSTSSRVCCCSTRLVGIRRAFTFRFIAGLILSSSVILSAVFCFQPFHSTESGFDAGFLDSSNEYYYEKQAGEEIPKDLQLAEEEREWRADDVE